MMPEASRVYKNKMLIDSSTPMESNIIPNNIFYKRMNPPDSFLINYGYKFWVSERL